MERDFSGDVSSFVFHPVHLTEELSVESDGVVPSAVCLDIESRFDTVYHSSRGGHGIEWIVVHYTASLGSASNNANRLVRKLKSPYSSHFFVDSVDIINTVPVSRSAWHVGGPSGKRISCFNQNSIGVDLCESKLDSSTRRARDTDWYFSDDVFSRGALLCAYLMSVHNIPIERLVRHYDCTGKLCPRPFSGSGISEHTGISFEGSWLSFKERVCIYL